MSKIAPVIAWSAAAASYVGTGVAMSQNSIWALAGIAAALITTAVAGDVSFGSIFNSKKKN